MPWNLAAGLYAAMIRLQEQRAAAAAALYLNRTLARMDAHRLRDIGIDPARMPHPVPEPEVPPGHPKPRP